MFTGSLPDRAGGGRGVVPCRQGTDLPVKRHYIATQKWSPDGISLSRDEGEEVYRSLILDSKIEDKEFSLKRR